MSTIYILLSKQKIKAINTSYEHLVQKMNKEEDDEIQGPFAIFDENDSKLFTISTIKPLPTWIFHRS